MEELSRKEGAGRLVTGAAKGWQGQRSAFDFGDKRLPDSMEEKAGDYPSCRGALFVGWIGHPKG